MTATGPGIHLHATDAAEVVELLSFLDDWLAICHNQIHEPLTRFVGNPAYDISQLRDDLRRSAFLLGADNGEQLFGNE